LGWLQRSTKCNHRHEAFNKAREWYDELRFRAKLGLTTDPKLFSLVADRYLEDLQREVDLGLRNPRHVRDYKPVVERYLKPFFGRMMIDEINNTRIEEYRNWRDTYWVTGPGGKQRIITYWRNGKEIRRPMTRGAPSRSTLIAEDVVLRGIFQIALRYGFIRPWQIPTITRPAPRRQNADTRRAAFTLEEYKQLAAFMADWWQSGRNLYRRLLLMLYVHVLVHSGMRPGTETDGLRWCDMEQFGRRPNGVDETLLEDTAAEWLRLGLKGTGIDHRPTEGGQLFSLAISVRGKTGARQLVPTRCCQFPFYVLRTLREGHLGHPVDPEERVFCLPDGTFQSADSLRQLFEPMLKKAGLLYDKDGKRRTLYSCRHTYATFSLLYRKVPVHTLARNMGTSVAMIERHYSHLTPRLAARDLE
jgi:integrase